MSVVKKCYDVNTLVVQVVACRKESLEEGEDD